MPLIISRTCSSVLPTIGSPLHKVGPVKKVAVSKKQQGIWEGDGMGEICGKVPGIASRDPRSRTSLLHRARSEYYTLFTPTAYPSHVILSPGSRRSGSTVDSENLGRAKE